MAPKTIKGWAAGKEKATRLERLETPVPALGHDDVLVEVSACGICHSDLHLIDNDWFVSHYPLVPGHEILGKVVAKGAGARLDVGTVVGVGWQRSACLGCDDCTTARDNLCDSRTATCVDHWGGYADHHVTDWRYAFPMPVELQTPAAAPLLCGGATVFSPLTQQLRRTEQRTARVGIVGMGGLGHLAVKLARALGYEVTLFSTSPRKEAEAKKMGADRFVSSKDPEAVKALGRRLDMVLVTGPFDMPWSAYLQTLRADGVMSFVGAPPSPLGIGVPELMGKRLSVASSSVASRGEIRDLLDFCARHRIVADTETFPMDQVNEAIDRVRKNDVRYRAVLVR